MWFALSLDLLLRLVGTKPHISKGACHDDHQSARACPIDAASWTVAAKRSMMHITHKLHCHGRKPLPTQHLQTARNERPVRLWIDHDTISWPPVICAPSVVSSPGDCPDRSESSVPAVPAGWIILATIAELNDQRLLHRDHRCSCCTGSHC